MKKFLLSLVLSLVVSLSLSAYDTYSIYGASLGFGSEKGTSNGISATASLGNFGIYMGAGIFPNASNLGFHLDVDMHLANWANTNSDSSSDTSGLGLSALQRDKSFAFAYQVELGPSFKKETDKILLQFSPLLSLGLEMELGQIHYNTYYYSYNVAYDYYGFLFGFGGDLSLAFNPANKYSFVMGSHLAYYPVYTPSISVSAKSGNTTYSQSIDIDFDDYRRFMMNIYLGLQIHTKR